ncbi:hypothetical protein NXW74_12540 [Bacteroides ovatus]|nr:hypothetical protein NXW74_12540 [Bacteroides ovatus]
MRKSHLFLLLLMFSINIQAQSIKVSKTDKFTKDKVVYTSYEKISSEAFIGTQTGKNIAICFGRENGLNMILMKWLTADVRLVSVNSKVVFLDEEDNTHEFTVSDYASGRGEGTVGALGMDLWGLRILLLGDLSVFKDHIMTTVRIYTTDGYYDYKIKKSAAEKARKAYRLFEKEIQKGNIDKWK